MTEYERKLEYEKARLAELERTSGLGWGVRLVVEEPGRPYDESSEAEQEWELYARLRQPGRIHSVIIERPENHPERF
jgi:hypothetical protein